MPRISPRKSSIIMKQLISATPARPQPLFSPVNRHTRHNGHLMKSKILVVDDESEAVELIDFNLRNAGYEVSAAIDGRQAITKARTIQPDLIVLDLMLPEIDGLEICKIL